MSASIRSRALPALLGAFRVTLAVGITLAADMAFGALKGWLSWGGLDGNAFLEIVPSTPSS